MRPFPIQARNAALLFGALVSLAMAQPQVVLGQSGPKVPSAQGIAKAPDAVDQEQFFPYWTTETGWDTELQLRNNLAGKSLLVTPFLRTADGTETALAAVTLQPHEVQSIDLDAAIGTGAPQLVGAYGSVVLRYHSVGLRNLYAALMLRTVGHPIAFHVDATGEIQNYEAASREGIWWLPDDSVSDYLILNNQGTNPIQLDLSLFDSVGKAFIQKIPLGPRQMSRLSVRRLVQLGGLTGSYGGIKISAAAHAGSLDSLHFLFDTQVGFSALLKMFDHDPNTIITERDNAKTGVWTLRAPMLALTQPDPALAFPDGTTLQPQLFIRNTTSKPLTAALRFNWRGDSVTGKAQGPTLQLNPYETRRFDIAALQDGKILPKDAHWTAVTLTTNGQPDEIMAVAASYDATLQHGAQTPFSDQLAFAWEGGMWEYDAQHNSLMTAGNGGTKPTRAALTLFYNHGTERYDLEQALQPDEQMWIDIGKLIREHVPDKYGKVLPADLSSGSYEFRDLNDYLAGTLFEGKVIYEKIYGHVTYGCMNCCDDSAPWLNFNPLGIPFGNNAPNGVNSDDCNGNQLDVSDSFYYNWTTANQAIATVDTYGTHTGAGVGSTTSYTFGPLMTQHGRICYNTQQHASGRDNVMTLSCSPSSVTHGSSVTCSVSNAPTGATFSSWQLKDSGNNTVNGSGTASSWPGTMVTSGTVTVSVAAGGNSTRLSASITVTNRNWHTAPATPAEAANGTFIALPVPPQNTGDDSGLGEFQWHYVLSSLQYSTINDNGPNQGYTYWPSNQIFSTWNFQYEINPDLENTGSTFYQAQCGNYNATTNPSGFISGSNLLAQTNRHEWNSSTQSHDAFYSNSLNSGSNNPGDFLEQQIAAPGANLNTFANNSTSGINSRLSTVKSDSQLQPYPVNYSEANVFLGNINYAPYTSCQ